MYIITVFNFSRASKTIALTKQKRKQRRLVIKTTKIIRLKDQIV
jgi:hypothetical protein